MYIFKAVVVLRYSAEFGSAYIAKIKGPISYSVYSLVQIGIHSDNRTKVI